MLIRRTRAPPSGAARTRRLGHKREIHVMYDGQLSKGDDVSHVSTTGHFVDGFATGEPQSAGALRPRGRAAHDGVRHPVLDKVWRDRRRCRQCLRRAPRIRASAPRSWGANNFGRPAGRRSGLDGLVGPEPPFHTPTFAAHPRPRPPIEMEGGTTFHFLEASPREALQTRVKQTAAGRAHRWRTTVVRDFLPPDRRSHAHRSGADRARRGGQGLGRPGGAREGYASRRFNPERRHAPDLHSERARWVR